MDFDKKNWGRNWKKDEFWVEKNEKGRQIWHFMFLFLDEVGIPGCKPVLPWFVTRRTARSRQSSALTMYSVDPSTQILSWINSR